MNKEGWFLSGLQALVEGGEKASNPSNSIRKEGKVFIFKFTGVPAPTCSTF